MHATAVSTTNRADLRMDDQMDAHQWDCEEDKCSATAALALRMEESGNGVPIIRQSDNRAYFRQGNALRSGPG